MDADKSLVVILTYQVSSMLVISFLPYLQEVSHHFVDGAAEALNIVFVKPRHVHSTSGHGVHVVLSSEPLDMLRLEPQVPEQSVLAGDVVPVARGLVLGGQQLQNLLSNSVESVSDGSDVVSPFLLQLFVTEDSSGYASPPSGSKQALATEVDDEIQLDGGGIGRGRGDGVDTADSLAV